MMLCGETHIPVGDYYALVDAADHDVVAGYRWRVLNGHNGKLYACTMVAGLCVYMHRLVALTPDGYETDHINGNGLDNRRVNLRSATPSQNSANMWKPRRPDLSQHSSRYKGVSWDKSRRKWQAKITVAQRCRSLGRYDRDDDAARAYDAAALAAWGEFAWLNFPAMDVTPCR
jgi:hypothetical protein